MHASFFRCYGWSGKNQPCTRTCTCTCTCTHTRTGVQHCLETFFYKKILLMTTDLLHVFCISIFLILFGLFRLQPPVYAYSPLPRCGLFDPPLPLSSLPHLLLSHIGFFSTCIFLLLFSLSISLLKLQISTSLSFLPSYSLSRSFSCSPSLSFAPSFPLSLSLCRLP